MKLALIRQRYNPFGGAERFVERALRALADQGVEITLITRSWQGAPLEKFRQIICDPSYSRLRGGRAARDRSFCTAVQALMAQEKFDLVQAHERIPGCSIFRAGDGVHAAWLNHRAKSLGWAGRLAQTLSPFHRAVLSAEQALFEHPALRTVICNSRMVAEEIQTFYGLPADKLTLIYNGVDHEAFHPRLADSHRETLRAAHGIPATAPLFLFVGSGFERKGVPRLLQAFAHLPEKSARLVIVGADRKLKAMRALAQKLAIADRVLFTGPLQDVKPWYGAADAFVLPTLYDPCPNAALEALACGLPSLVSRTCGAAEFITPGQNGWICNALDPEQIATQMAAMVDWTNQAGPRQAACAAVAHLTLPAMAEQLQQLYRTLLDSGKAAST